MASPPTDPQAFRDALGQFATGVTVVTAQTPDGELVGITVSSFNSVALEPPLVLFSIDRSSNSFDALSNTEAFAVNVLSLDQQDLAHRFASQGNNKWEGVAWHEGQTGVPVLDGVLAVFECTPSARHEGGDHVIFVARVERFDQSPEGAPLLFFRGGYRSLGR